MTDEKLVTEMTPPARTRHTFLGCDCIVGVVTILLLLAMIVALVLPSVNSGPRPTRRMQCIDNLKQISLAMHNYAQVYGSFPPAYTADRDGRPLHSWRALLLPYLDREDLFDRLKLDEPWDSPYNRSVLQDDEATRLYHCPSAESPKHETSYVMVVGPNTISDGPHSVRFEDITDGASNTVMIVEVKDSHIHWAEPRDLALGDMSFQINDPNGKGVGSYHSGVANAALADGSVRFLGDNTPPNLLKALITINGGEDVSEFMNQ